MKIESDKAYLVKTQEDFDSLLQVAEQQGLLWTSGHKPTKADVWYRFDDKTIVYIKDEYLVYGAGNLPTKEVVEYKK